MTHAVRRQGRKERQVPDPRELPNYRLPEAAHYLRVPDSTLRMWIFGQAYPTTAGRKVSRPIISVAGEDPPRLSFVNMVEAHVLTAIRYRHGIALPAVRRAVEYLTQEFGTRHPLADEQFQTDGVNLFVERLGLLNVSAPGQYAMPEILRALLRRIERDERGLAVRLYPFSRRPVPEALEESPRLVVIDPRVAFGRPILSGSGVTTSSIAERFDAGESIEALAADYGRTRDEVEEAIRCELTRDAA
ncbi:MAG: DUF433 domain-containing protein [Candidatus Rokuibacteriota bacterium]